jgi:hypothetical protein
MAGKNTAVFGIYRTRPEAESAVDQLLASDFRSEDISVLLQDNVGTKDFAHEKHTKAPEGTTTGVIAGGAVGGTLGLLAGIGVLAIRCAGYPRTWAIHSRGTDHDDFGGSRIWWSGWRRDRRVSRYGATRV